VNVAFFDMDKTLFAVNSGALWVRRELEAGHITRWQALQAGCFVLLYSLGMLPLEGAILRAISTLRGLAAEPLRERAEEFFQGCLQAVYRPGALLALKEHRRAGDRCVLLTASPSYLAALVARDLRLDGYLSTELEVDGAGVHTGRPRALCFGPGKLRLASAFAERDGVSLAECTFYTDSYTDLPMLDAVGRPVAVNPDQRLRREALRRGWKVVDWGVPEPAGSPSASPGGSAPSLRAPP